MVSGGGVYKMPDYSHHYNLIKPKKEENYDIDDVSRINMDIIDSELYQRVEKEAGKGLSQHDFNDSYKRKLDSLTSVFLYKGSVNTYSELELKENNKIGDIWHCVENATNYSYNGSTWTPIGLTVDLSELLTVDDFNNEKETIMSIINLNKNDMKTNREIITVSNIITKDIDYTIPVKYVVGNKSLEIYHCGERLVLNKDYIEIGNTGTISQLIQFKENIGDIDVQNVIEGFSESLEFVSRGDFSDS